MTPISLRIRERKEAKEEKGGLLIIFKILATPIIFVLPNFQLTCETTLKNLKRNHAGIAIK